MTRLAVCLLAACAGAEPRAVPDAPSVTPDAPVAAPALWALTHDGTTNRLYRMNPTTMTIERTTQLAYANLLWELAGFTPQRAYAIDRDSDVLVTIDLDAGTIVATTQLAGDMQQNGRGFGATASGILYGLFGTTMKQIDPTTGALTAPVAVQLGQQAEALDACGSQLYMTSRESGSPRGEKLYALDPATGQATLRGAIGAMPIDIDTLACLDGKLYGVDTDPTLGRTLYQIDPASGTPLSTTLLSVVGDVNGVHATSVAMLQ